MVSGVHHHLNKELWTPQAFERDFGEEPADLVDCRLGMVLLQLPSKTFWAGFDNMNSELIVQYSTVQYVIQYVCMSAMVGTVIQEE